MKGKKQKKIKDDEEHKNNSKENKAAEAAGYIHVRARRGQATDSHSLAERVYTFYQYIFHFNYYYIHFTDTYMFPCESGEERENK